MRTTAGKKQKPSVVCQVFRLAHPSVITAAFPLWRRGVPVGVPVEQADVRMAARMCCVRIYVCVERMVRVAMSVGSGFMLVSRHGVCGAWWAMGWPAEGRTKDVWDEMCGIRLE